MIGLVLTTTSMGALIPILDDAGVADKPFGAFAFGAGALGEFAPIIAITVLLIGDNPWTEGLWLGAFVVVAVALVLVASRPTPPRFDALISRHLATYGQLPVRVAVLLLALDAVPRLRARRRSVARELHRRDPLPADAPRAVSARLVEPRCGRSGSASRSRSSSS